MSAGEEAQPFPFARVVALHCLGWLVAANLVGVWMGVCLVWPEIGDLLAPLTYGRWAPLHLDWQLYGWCSLPLVGALLAWCLEEKRVPAKGHAQLALTAWSLALALGGLSWLGGGSSGKLFLDWHGWTRPLLPVAMQLLWAVLAAHTVWRWRGFSLAEKTQRLAVLGALVAVPPVLYWSTARAVYHPINPDSGGATGAAVLGSTLGIVTIYMLLPTFLRLKPRGARAPFVCFLAASWAVFAAVDRGNVSHHVPAQAISLAVLLVWIPLLPLFWRRHEWGGFATPWLRAAAGWWAVLVLTGWITFLPGVSERLKFTHAMVGHSHLAMAALVTAVNGAILMTLVRRHAPGWAFWLWQGGCTLYIVSMYALGWHETECAAELFRSASWTQALLGLRLFAGATMTAASVGWLGIFLRR